MGYNTGDLLLYFLKDAFAIFDLLNVIDFNVLFFLFDLRVEQYLLVMDFLDL